MRWGEVGMGGGQGEDAGWLSAWMCSLGLHLALGVSGHSSLQFCQLGAVALWSHVVGGASIAPHYRCSMWLAGPALDLTSLLQLVLHYPPPST